MPEETASPFATAATTEAAPTTSTPPAAATEATGDTSTPPAAAVEATGDTSFLDNLSAIEPLMKPGVFPGVIAALACKTASNGNPYVSITAQLYGEGMMLEDGTPVSPGKRLTSSVFASSNSEEWLRLTGAELKQLVLALNDIPLDSKADAAYMALPITSRITGPARTPSGFIFNVGCLEPADQWTGKKVLVNVKIKKDKQTGATRNEFTLLAASTPQTAKKTK